MGSRFTRALVGLMLAACTEVSVRNETNVEVCDVELRFPERATSNFGRLAPGGERSSWGDTRDEGTGTLCARPCDGAQLQCAPVSVFLAEFHHSRVAIVTQGSGRSDELVLRALDAPTARE